MTIANIIDRRKRRYRYRKINAIVEATSHDNYVADADQSDGEGPVYDQLEHRSLADAILWAQKFDGEVTLYLYDEDDGLYSRNPRSDA
jgi:hypothetical protein